MLQLADALDDIEPGILELIKNRTAEDQRAALTTSELKAAAEDSKTKLGVLNGNLKEHLEAGGISRFQLPYAQIGYSRRAGQDIASAELSTLLDSRLADATKADAPFDPEGVIKQATDEIRSQLPKDNVYALQGFQQEADRQAETFRRKAKAVHEQKFVQAQEARIGSRILDFADAYAFSDPDNKDAIKAEVHQFISTVKEEEMPRHRVGPLVASKALEAVQDILSQNPTATDEAETVLDLFHDYDLTGQGGLLGKASASRQFFITARQEIRKAAEKSETVDLEVTKRNATDRQLGADAALAALAELDGQTLDKAARNRLADSFRKSEDGRNPQKLSGYLQTLDRAISQADKQDDDRALSTASRMLATIDPAKLDEAESFIRQAEQRGDLRALTVAQQLEPALRKARSLSSIYDTRWLAIASTKLYGEDVDGPGTLTPTFTIEETPELPGLSQDELREHQRQTLSFFEQAAQRHLVEMSEGDPMKAVQVREKARSEAYVDTVKYAENLAKEMTKAKVSGLSDKKEKDLEARVIRGDAMRGTLSVEASDILESRPGWLANLRLLPDPAALAKNWKEPHLPDPDSQKTPRQRWLEEVARQSPGSEPHALAYAVVKSAEGYSLEEMKAGRTSEGVPLNPRLINWRNVPLFKNRKELEAAYSKRQDKNSVFNEVHLLVDPGKIHSPQELYQQQAILLGR
ncbi:hypothetical protein AW736_00545 [Termitidicoccus mucosus]|uniref:Uncharacterized protein n=2 Tax=Termitidicoccus mucosus TaxID=1184151 RepID=A0A178IKQ4_9BACT|nr:hypothetical protein AW736_00545 [Opitutaceae bacterium TSB47]